MDSRAAPVIPAQAGIQEFRQPEGRLDARFRGHDDAGSVQDLMDARFRGHDDAGMFRAFEKRRT